MTNYEFVGMLLHIANDLKTLYVLGGFGFRLDASGKQRAFRYAYNCEMSRKNMINNATADTWAFDCVCLVKSVLWGFRGDKKFSYGGAVYGSNGVKDGTINYMLDHCRNVSTDMNNIEVGEFLYLHSHHCGVYVGNGLVVESTPNWKNCVQVTKLSQRSWKKHGKLEWVKYESSEDDYPYPQYTDTELAYRVIAGEHGNGDTRKEDLGSRYRTVQNIVNDILAKRKEQENVK